MIATRPGRTGTLDLHLTTPTPSVLLLTVRDDGGRVLLRRRVHGRRVSVPVVAGRVVVTLDDERASTDPRRLRGETLTLDVPAGGVVRRGAHLVRGAALEVTTAGHAHVTASQAGGERVEVRADGAGRVVLGGLRPGAWTVVAHDRRRSLVSSPVAVTVDAGGTADLRVHPDLEVARLLVRLRGTDRRPVLADHVVVTDAAGRRVTAPVRDGVADVRDLAPGAHRVGVPTSVGHRGATLEVADLAPGDLATVEVSVPIGATLSGRVVQGVRQYAAVVTLVDEVGREVERVRTDERGRFLLGRGLGSRSGLTVVATTGPETLHVTRTAVADVAVVNGVRHDLGDLVLPVAGPRAVWTARQPVRGTKPPTPRV